MDRVSGKPAVMLRCGESVVQRRGDGDGDGDGKKVGSERVLLGVRGGHERKPVYRGVGMYELAYASEA